MISILLREDAVGFYLKAEGHSGKSGSSIVCAGVSVLLESWRLSEELLEGVRISVADGFIEGFAPKSEISRVLFFQLGVGLHSLARQYPKEIKINSGGHHGI